MAEPAKKQEYEETLKQDQRNLQPIEGGGESSEPTGRLRAVPNPEAEYDRNDSSPVTGPTLKVLEGAGEGSGQPKGNLSSVSSAKSKSTTPSELKEKESTAGDAVKGSVPSAEKSLYNSAAPVPPTIMALNKAAKLFFSKKGARGGGVIVGFLGIVAFMSIVSGPLQVIHFSQQLQGHFDSNRNHSDSRTSAIILNAVAGKGAQNGRLGITGNFLANKYQQRLVDSTGFKPAYEGKQRLLNRYEIVDRDKALRTLQSISIDDSPGLKSLKDKLENGEFDYITADNDTYDSQSKRLPNGAQTLDFGKNGLNLSVKEIKIFQFALSKETNMNRIAQYTGYRLSGKRSGIGLHPMKIIQKALNDRSIARNEAKNLRDAEKEAYKMEEEREKAILEGTQPGEAPSAAPTEQPDEEGNPTKTSDVDVEASEETKKFMADFKRTGVVKSGASAAVIVGVLCSAKAYGNGVEEYKYTNNVLPMMRMGMDAVAHGDQTKSGDDFSLINLKLFNDFLYDKKKKTSVMQAESIRAEQGKKGGIPMPDEADLGKAGEKPKLFKTLDSIGPLVAVCGVVDTVSNLPIIKQVSTVISDGTTKAIDGALSAAGTGTSTDELMQKSLKAVAGRGVDPLARGADLGNMANAGVFLAANDQALTMGGQALTNKEVAELKQSENEDRAVERSQKSIAERYLNPYDKDSAVGTLIDSSPTNLDQAASMITSPAQKFSQGFGGIFSALIPKTSAETITYDYGVPKYGFSISEQRDPQFADPYVNADIVEPELTRLNAEYGEKCFGVTVTTDEKGVHIKSSDKPVNTFKVREKHPECIAQSNTDEKFNHYRFYISDVMTAVSLSCYEGDEEHCAELGFKAGTITGEEQPDAQTIDGDLQALAKQMLENKKISYWDGGTAPTSQVVKDLAEGKKAKTSSSDGPAVEANQNGGVNINPNILKAILEYAQSVGNVQVNALTDKDHSTNSNHYKGTAVDFECGIDTNKMDAIAKKYGGARNGETCAKNAHWHYDYPK